MNSDRMTKLAAVAILGFLGLAGLAYVAHTMYTGLEDRQSAIEKAEQKRIAANRDVQRLLAAKREVEQWRAVSLPPDPNQANLRYAGMLYDLLMRHQIFPTQMPDASTTQPGRGSNKIFRTLTYQWKVECNLLQLISFLEEFHRLNLPHAIRDISVINQGNGPTGRLEVSFKVEALSFASPQNRDFLPSVPDRNVVRMEFLAALKGTPTGLAFALSQFAPTGLYGNVAHRTPPRTVPRPGQPLAPEESTGLLARSKLAGDLSESRDYRRLHNKNIYVGLDRPPTVPTRAEPQPDRMILDHMQLTMIDENDVRTVAELRDKLNNRFIKVRAEPPLNDLVVRDAANFVLLRAKVVALTTRMMLLEIDEKFYAVPVGGLLGPCIQEGKHLTEKEIKAYNLPVSNGKVQ